jgi:hypothetical protein
VKYAIIMTVLLSLGASNGHQTAPVTPLQLPGGVYLPVATEDPIDVERMKVGDALTMRTTNNLLNEDKSIAIPKGAKARGHVTVVEPLSTGKTSRFGFVVESVEWSDGRAKLIAEIAEPSASPSGGAGKKVPAVWPPIEQVQKAALASVPLVIAKYSELRVESSADGAVLVSDKKDIRLPKGCRLTLVTK